MAAPAGALAPVQSGAPDYYTRCLRIDNAVGHLIVGFLDSQELGTIGDKGTILAVNRVTQKYFAAGFRFQKEGPTVVPERVDIVLQHFPDARSLTIKASFRQCNIQSVGPNNINRLVALTICKSNRLDDSIYPNSSLQNLLDRSPQLASIKVSVDMLTDQLELFVGLRNLTELDLSESNFITSYRSYTWLQNLPSLRKLALPHAIKTEIKIAVFQTNRGITHLDLSNTHNVDAVTQAVGRNLTQLRHLTMPSKRSYMGSDEAFAELKGASLLESLRLTEFTAHDRPSQILMALTDFPCLSHLSVPLSTLNWKAIAALVASPSITSLSLERSLDSDEALLNLQKMRKLESLNLLNSKVSFITIRAIVVAHQEHLRFLAISCPLVKEGLVFLLGTAKKLEVLHCTLHDYMKEESLKYVNDVNTTLLGRRIYVHPYKQFSLELNNH